MNTITVKTDGSGITVSAQGPQGPQGPAGTLGNIVEVSSAYSTSTADAVVIATGTFTVTLHSLSIANKEIAIKSALGLITVAADGSDTIEGLATIDITTGQSVTLVPTTSEWVII